MKKDIKVEREFYEKCGLTFVILTCWLIAPKIGYENFDLENTRGHMLYMLCHANLWHLLGNIFVLWFLRGKLYLAPSMLIAFLCSYIPAFSIYGEIGITMGFSGVVFAIAGIKWGAYCLNASRRSRDAEMTAFEKFLVQMLPLALIGILIPHLNWCLHSYCLIAGFIYGRCRR